MEIPGLSAAQVEQIRGFVEKLPRVTEARLYGSRLKGTHRPDSDVDLALTVPDVPQGLGVDDGFTLFWFDHEEWEVALGSIIGLRIHLERYDAETHPTVFGFCTERSLLIWKRHT